MAKDIHPATMEHLLVENVPDWEHIDFEVCCARCGYNLRMLPKAQCPECGLGFDWESVLDKALWKSKFLFEHHWRSRPIHSWATTVYRSLRPKRFWSQVSIHEHANAGPLWFLVLTAPLLHVGLWWLASAAINVAWWVRRDILPPPNPWRSNPTISYLEDLLYESLRFASVYGLGGPDEWLAPLIALSGLILLTLLTICSLRQTLGKCKVRTVQVLRVAAYAVAPAMVCSSVLVRGVLGFLQEYSFGSTVVIGLDYLLVILIIPSVVIAFFVSVGLRRYLQLPRPALLATTASGIGFLIVMTTAAIYVLVTRAWL